MRINQLQLRRLAPLLISAIALSAVFYFSDLRDFGNLASRLRWNQLPGIGLLMFAIVCAYAWRWRTLVREGLPLSRSVLVCALGIAGNQVLPLRGGDAVRVVLSGRGANAPSLHAAVSALALEKLLDLIAVAGFAIVSASLLIGARDGETRMNLFAAATAIVVVAVSVLLMARSGLLIKAVRNFARLLRVRPRYYRHIFQPLDHLRHLASPRRIFALLLQTALIWVVLDVLAYLAVASFIGIDLRLTDTVVLVCAGALGVAIPAAPSALGTLHAAIVSAFVLLGRSAAEGLVFAVAFHGVFFVGLCIIGAVALAIATYQLGPVRIPRENV